MRSEKLFAVVVSCTLILCSIPGWCQSVTGFQPFGTFNKTGVEIVNPGSFNIHWTVPIISKAGRIPFDYALNFDSGVCTVNGFGGLNCGGTWQSPAASVFGQLFYYDIPQSCY